MSNFYNILISKILNEIIPASKISISKGNKIFGAALLKKKDLSTVVIGTNNEIVNPLYHGEISTIFNPKQTIPAYIEFVDIAFCRPIASMDDYLAQFLTRYSRHIFWYTEVESRRSGGPSKLSILVSVHHKETCSCIAYPVDVYHLQDSVDKNDGHCL